ncbi:MAG TPA: zinc ribbon domain-containing protein, partial [Candidatus Limnocylindria bacterium]|nr:zinc ribbon domain-containing protein [Candidatus Limnocylindria bacterium]
MEAERPMQNDERDERDLPPDDPSQPPPPDVGDEADSADAETAEAADEFETASWPSHDRAPSQQDTTQPPEEPDGADTFATDEVAAPMPPMAEPDDEVLAAESGPPPPEVEAYEGSADAVATEAGAVVAAHSVPATTEPGESTRCPRCGTENRPGIAFCQNCGQRLIAAGAPATVERPA